MATNLIPFGKYKGQPVEQLQNDQEYANWLIQQPWFAARFGKIHTLIVNNFKEAVESPDHNAMQARFLKRQYAYSVANSVCKLIPFDRWNSNEVEPFKKKYEEEYGAPCDEKFKIECHFELRGWDVCFLMASLVEGYSNSEINRNWGWGIHLELKPTLGEDFPAVLRQVTTRHMVYSYSNCKVRCLRCVLIDRFVANSVSFEEVYLMFLMSGINLIKSSDVVIQEMPDWVVNWTQ